MPHKPRLSDRFMDADASMRHVPYSPTTAPTTADAPTDTTAASEAGTSERDGLALSLEPAVLLSALDGCAVPYEAYGLAARILLAVAAHATELEHAGEKGTLELHWGPNGVSGRFTQVWDERLAGARVDAFTPTPTLTPTHPQGARPAPALRRRGGHYVIVGTEHVGDK